MCIKVDTSMSSSPDGKLYKLIEENIVCSKYMNVIKLQHKFAYNNFLTTNAIAQWSAENGITEKLIMSVCVYLVIFLGMSTIL